MSSDPFRTIHHICHGPDNKLLSFNRDHAPRLVVDSGSEVTFDSTNSDFHRITRDTTTADLIAIGYEGPKDLEKIMGPIFVNGPVYVNSAEPGDMLKVEILKLQTGPWGWTAILPGAGMLQEEIPGVHLKTFDLPASQDYAVFKEGVVHIPCQPFYGTMAVAQAEEGDRHPLHPCNDIGGNFDCRYIGEGATLYLPVQVPGALFMVGDAHWSQGDGEITGIALETTMKSRMRFTVIKGKGALQTPHYETDPERVKRMVSVGGKGEHGTLSRHKDRGTAVKLAALEMIRWMREEKGLTEEEAYMLFSICGNLKIMHDFGLNANSASASIPLGIFLDELDK